MSNSSRRRRHRAEPLPPAVSGFTTDDWRRVRWALGVTLAFVVVTMGGGLVYRRYARPDLRAEVAGEMPLTDGCAYRYQLAKTAADTAIVDRLDMGNWRAHQICGILRRRAEEDRAWRAGLPRRGLTNR